MTFLKTLFNAVLSNYILVSHMKYVTCQAHIQKSQKPIQYHIFRPICHHFYPSHDWIQPIREKNLNPMNNKHMILYAEVRLITRGSQMYIKLTIIQSSDG